MDFLISAGSATNLPKEIIGQLVELAVEKSVILKLSQDREQFVELVNEGTLPVLGAEDLTKFYRIDGTSDITTLTESDFSIQTPDLRPVETGAYTYLSRKQLKQYSQFGIDNLFKKRLSRGISRLADKIALVGDTSAGGATNALTIADGVVTIAGDVSKCAATPVSYTTSNAQSVLNAVADAIEQIGVYGGDEYKDDLVILASSDFVKAAKTSASNDYVGYEIADYPALGLKKVVTLHGIPVIRRLDIPGEQAVLANALGLYCGYYGDQMTIDVEHKAALRKDLMVITFWFDFKWGLLNSSSKALGLVKIAKSS